MRMVGGVPRGADLVGGVPLGFNLVTSGGCPGENGLVGGVPVGGVVKSWRMLWSRYCLLAVSRQREPPFQTPCRRLPAFNGILWGLSGRVVCPADPRAVDRLLFREPDPDSVFS